MTRRDVKRNEMNRPPLARARRSTSTSLVVTRRGESSPLESPETSTQNVRTHVAWYRHDTKPRTSIVVLVRPRGVERPSSIALAPRRYTVWRSFPRFSTHFAASIAKTSRARARVVRVVHTDAHPGRSTTPLLVGRSRPSWSVDHAPPRGRGRRQRARVRRVFDRGVFAHRTLPTRSRDRRRRRDDVVDARDRSIASHDVESATNIVRPHSCVRAHRAKRSDWTACVRRKERRADEIVVATSERASDRSIDRSHIRSHSIAFDRSID